MDYLMRKLENKLLLNDPGSYEYITILKTQIEYCIYFSLGYLWKNLHEISQEKRSNIFNHLNNMSIGSAVSAIDDLDVDNQVMIREKHGKKGLDPLLGKYPFIRNTKMGHGYAIATDIASSLTPLYNELIDSIPLLKQPSDIIIVKNFDPHTNTYKGIRLPYDMNGDGVRWSCPQEVFNHTEEIFPKTYCIINNKYFKLSPFVYLDNQLDVFVFSSLVEKLVGKTKMCRLFPSETQSEPIDMIFKELVSINDVDEFRIYSKSNGTIMNNFIPNYKHYIDVGMRNVTMNFLKENKAYVTATIWGHGGVGKTACIQKVCFDLLNDSKMIFAYIVYITAKDRAYNTRTGKIIETRNNNSSYAEIIETISKTIFNNQTSFQEFPDLLSEYETQIRNLTDSVLFVIDDFETFEDSEKEKISAFLNTLNARYHKVIITTRNKRFVIGEEIPSNEFSLPKTKKFILDVIQADYPELFESMKKLLADDSVVNNIHIATSGRPIFIYQFIYIYMQKGYRKELIDGIRNSKDAKAFLYGRIFRYLSPDAQYLFVTIPMLKDADLRFNMQVLRYSIEKYITNNDSFNMALKELVAQKVIEINNDIYGRIYSSELLEIMTYQYNKYPQEFKDTLRTLIDNIGGKDIKGSILQAMLAQADTSRTFGNEQETIEKYRHVLNANNCPYYIRKNALKHLSDYLSNARLNPLQAIKMMEDYLHYFENDPEIYTLYVYLLWAQEVEFKSKAINSIQKYFSSHKKTARESLSFFALGVGYYIDYDLRFRTYENEKFRLMQENKTFNEYGRTLFEYLINNPFLSGKAALYHNIRVALIQTIKLCYSIAISEINISPKLDYALKICTWLRRGNLAEPFLTQINNLESKVLAELNGTNDRKDNDLSSEYNNVVILDNTQDNMDSIICDGARHSKGDIINVKIINIMPYGVLTELDNIKGLIHISEIDNRYIENIFNEFEVGEICPAKITSIDNIKKEIGLSTKGLGKFQSER